MPFGASLPSAKPRRGGFRGLAEGKERHKKRENKMRVEIQKFQKSINESDFSLAQIAMIWDFYVTHSVAASASQKRTVKDYELSSFPWNEMSQKGGFSKDQIKILPANSINKTLKNYDLEVQEGKGEKKQNKAIEIDEVRIVCLTQYSICDEDKPSPRCGEAESVLTHIRNSFAHGLTFFFDNGNVLFEDKDNRGTITARIIMHQQTLLDWISLIDHKQKFYVLHDLCDSCGQKELAKGKSREGLL